MGADMSALQLTSARSPQTFARIVGVPDIKVPHLRPHRRGHTKHMPGRHLPRPPRADRHLELFDQRALAFLITNTLIERRIHLQRRTFADLVRGRVVFVHGACPLSRVIKQGEGKVF